MWQFKFLALVTPFGRKIGEMSRKLIWQRSHQGTMRDRSAALAYYHQHIADVKASVPAEQLLVYSVVQVWAPLDAFLGVPEPGGDFPNANARAAINPGTPGLHT